MNPYQFKSQVEYITAIYTHWEKQDPENNRAKLCKIVDSDVTYQTMRRFLNGESCNDFCLFESILRALNISFENYKKAVSRWYPSMLQFAERIHRAGKKLDKTSSFTEHYYDLFQRMVTLEPKTKCKKYIGKEWGRKGLEVANYAVETEQLTESDDGKLQINSPDNIVYMGRSLVSQLIGHNSIEYHNQPNPSKHDLCRYRVFYLSKEKADLFKKKAEELYELIDDEVNESSDGQVVYAMQILFRVID